MLRGEKLSSTADKRPSILSGGNSTGEITSPPKCDGLALARVVTILEGGLTTGGGGVGDSGGGRHDRNLTICTCDIIIIIIIELLFSFLFILGCRAIKCQRYHSYVRTQNN